MKILREFAHEREECVVRFRVRDPMITKKGIRYIVRRALKEDVGRGDVTSRWVVPKQTKVEAEITAKQVAIVCGMDLVREAFRQAGKNIHFEALVEDGRVVRPGKVVARIRGRARPILKAERTALNFLQQLSGIATLTRRFVNEVRGTGAKILGTRKTTPGLRPFQKYAVRCGGGVNHRMGLYDDALIKENHLEVAVKDLQGTIRRMRRRRQRGRIIIETENMTDVKLAAGLEVDTVMLDDFDPKELRRAVRFLRKVRPDVEIEASGGVGIRNVRRVARTGVDRISIGALTHSAPAVDYSLLLKRID